MSTLSTAISIALVTTVGVVGTAATISTTATTKPANIATVEMKSQTRVAALAAALKSAAVEYRAARAKCEVLTPTEQSSCDDAARAAHKQAKQTARNKYRSAVKAPANAALPKPAKARNGEVVAVDAILYRAHRQLVDAPAACFADGNNNFNAHPKKQSIRIAMN